MELGFLVVLPPHRSCRITAADSGIASLVLQGRVLGRCRWQCVPQADRLPARLGVPRGGTLYGTYPSRPNVHRVVWSPKERCQASAAGQARVDQWRAVLS